MTTRVQELINVARRLSPVEQLELIQTLSHSLQQQWSHSLSVGNNGASIPAEVARTRPVSDLSELAADFWPVDESADDIAAFIGEQRLIDRTNG